MSNNWVPILSMIAFTVYKIAFLVFLISVPKRIWCLLLNSWRTLVSIFMAFTIAGWIAIILGLLMDFFGGIHWSLGAILAIIVILGSIWLANLVQQSQQTIVTRELVVVLALSLLPTAMVGAWTSFLLNSTGVGIYKVPADVSLGDFYDLYVYTFFDLLPGIKIWETLNVSAPIVAKNFVAGLPILGFRLFVLWLIIDAWRKGRAPKDPQRRLRTFRRKGSPSRKKRPKTLSPKS